MWVDICGYLGRHFVHFEKYIRFSILHHLHPMPKLSSFRCRADLRAYSSSGAGGVQAVVGGFSKKNRFIPWYYFLLLHLLFPPVRGREVRKAGGNCSLSRSTPG